MLFYHAARIINHIEFDYVYNHLETYHIRKEFLRKVISLLLTGFLEAFDGCYMLGVDACISTTLYTNVTRQKDFAFINITSVSTGFL